MGKVYITQIPERRTQDGSFVPTINIAPAAEFGEIVVLCERAASIWKSDELVRDLRKKLKFYNAETDFLVALGDPSIIAAAFAILGKDFGAVSLLKWDRIIKRYLPTKIRI